MIFVFKEGRLPSDGPAKHYVERTVTAKSEAKARSRLPKTSPLGDGGILQRPTLFHQCQLRESFRNLRLMEFVSVFQTTPFLFEDLMVMRLERQQLILSTALLMRLLIVQL